MMMIDDSRLQPAAALRDQSQPAEGAKPTAGRQPRQVSNTVLWQCKGHEVLSSYEPLSHN